MRGRSSSTLLGEILVSHGVISLAQRHEAVCKQRNTGRRIGEVMQDLGFVTISQINAALADQQWRRQQRLQASEHTTKHDAEK